MFCVVLHLVGQAKYVLPSSNPDQHIFFSLQQNQTLFRDLFKEWKTGKGHLFIYLKKILVMCFNPEDVNRSAFWDMFCCFQVLI